MPLPPWRLQSCRYWHRNIIVKNKKMQKETKVGLATNVVRIGARIWWLQNNNQKGFLFFSLSLFLDKCDAVELVLITFNYSSTHPSFPSLLLAPVFEGIPWYHVFLIFWEIGTSILVMFFLKSHNKQDMLVLVACDPSTQEAKSGGSLDIPGESKLQEWASAQSGL